MKLFNRVIKYFMSDKEKERLAIAEFRNELSFFGHDIYDMTDEEIKQGLSNISEVMKACGMTISEVGKAHRTMATFNK